MSSTSRSARKPQNILDKKIPKNPKYEHVSATVDTGASVTGYTQKIEEMRKYYKYRKDEIFKRMKVSTLVQLILQVAEVQGLEQERERLSTAGGESVISDATITAEESEPIIPGEGVPPLNFNDDDVAEARLDSTARNTARSTLESLIHGVGEVDIHDKDEKDSGDTDNSDFELEPPDVESLPYLLLDLRDQDAFDQCHIIGALHYPSSMLSRSYNYFTKEILMFKNKLGKIIILYDEDERLSPAAATTFVQREVDNVFMLSGGLKILYKKFPEGLLTGTVPQSCYPTPPPSRRSAGKTSTGSRHKPPTPANQKWFYPDDLNNLQDKLDDELLSQDKTSRQSSRMTSRSGMSSAASRASTAASSATNRSGKPSWK